MTMHVISNRLRFASTYHL